LNAAILPYPVVPSPELAVAIGAAGGHAIGPLTGARPGQAPYGAAVSPGPYPMGPAAWPAGVPGPSGRLPGIFATGATVP
jgi:hypothetical protein